MRMKLKAGGRFRFRKSTVHTTTTQPTKAIAPEKKPLFLIMEKYWFDEILEGRKDIEYRDNTPFYQSRLLNKQGEFRNYESVIMQVGYNKEARRMQIEIKKIENHGGFEIHLGKIIDTNF